jgi:hypothetical protein
MTMWKTLAVGLIWVAAPAPLYIWVVVQWLLR